MIDGGESETVIFPNAADPIWRALPLWTGLENVAGFGLPAATQQRFLDVHAHLTKLPRLDVLARLEPKSEGKRDWYRRLSARVLDNVQEGVGACHYHVANIRHIELGLHQIVRDTVPGLNLPSQTAWALAGGNTRRINYEYQAFLLATRRTMEYFAGSVAAFFKAEDPGFRGLAGCIARSEPEDERDHVLEVLSVHSGLISELLSEHPRLTVRDQVAHFQPVQAGTFNLICHPTADPVFHLGLMGGGEELLTFDPLDADPRPALAEALCALLERIELLIFESYAAMGIASE